MNKGIDIVIINYYSKSKIERLITSIINSSISIGLINIIIVNNSPDDDLKPLLENQNISIITNPVNKGFGYACNQAVPYLKHEFCLLLNPDTILFKDTLEKSIEYLEAHKDVTALGVKHYNEHNTVVPSCSRFPTVSSFFFDSILLSKISPQIFTPLFLMKDWNHLESRYVDQVMGAYIMVRKSFIEKFGLMDERYFVFLEDMDFCKKIWDNGGKVFYNADIALIHEGASSTEGVSDKKMAYLMEGKIKYCRKHFTKLKYFLALPCIVVIEPIIRLLVSIFTDFKNCRLLFTAYALFLKRINRN